MDANLGLLPIEEHRLKLFESRTLKRIFGPKREDGAKD
jgi:hypothetical protein